MILSDPFFNYLRFFNKNLKSFFLDQEKQFHYILNIKIKINVHLKDETWQRV
jgi:hypothetical protein